MTDFADWQAPQAHATAISTTGVPLLTGQSQLVNSGAVPLLVNHKTILGNVLVSQPGYQILVAANIANTATSPFVLVELGWFDAGVAQQIHSDSYVVAAGTSPANYTVAGSGPTKGDSVVVSVTSLDPAVGATVSVIMLQNSRVYPADSWNAVNGLNSGVVVPGITSAQVASDESDLGVITNGTIPASGSANWLLGMGGNGWVNLAGNLNTITPASITVTVLAEPTSLYGGGAFALREILTAASFTFQFKAPKCPLRINFTNASTVAGTASFMATLAV